MRGALTFLEDVFGEFHPGFGGYAQAVVIVLLTLVLLPALISVMVLTNHASSACFFEGFAMEEAGGSGDRTFDSGI